MQQNQAVSLRVQTILVFDHCIQSAQRSPFNNPTLEFETALSLNHIAWDADLHPTSEVFRTYVHPPNVPLGNSTASPHYHAEEVARPYLI
jgi:hypothetical protein